MTVQNSSLEAELAKLENKIKNLPDKKYPDISNALYELSLLARGLIQEPIKAEMGTREASTNPNHEKSPAQIGYNIEAYTQRLLMSGGDIDAHHIREIYTVLRHYSDAQNKPKGELK